MKTVWHFFFELPKLLLVGTVKAYRLLISPSLGAGCRFEPTCSAYALESLEQYGAIVGSYMTLRRLARCHPWCDGGFDPVPGKEAAENTEHSPIFTRLVTPVTSQSSEKNRS